MGQTHAIEESLKNDLKKVKQMIKRNRSINRDRERKKKSAVLQSGETQPKN